MIYLCNGNQVPMVNPSHRLDPSLIRCRETAMLTSFAMLMLWAREFLSLLEAVLAMAGWPLLSSDNSIPPVVIIKMSPRGQNPSVAYHSSKFMHGFAISVHLNDSI